MIGLAHYASIGPAPDDLAHGARRPLACRARTESVMQKLNHWRPRIGIFLVAAALSAVLVLSPSFSGDGLFVGFEAYLERALASGDFALALGIVFLAGMGTSLTPCVYPMIAITVSVFGARQAKSRTEAAMLSTSFVAGIAALLTPLGVVAGTSGALFGAWLASPIVLVALAIFFLAMGASMFGAFELSLPPALQNRLAQAGGSGYRGAFVLGLVSALIAAPCTGPILLALLTWIGRSGNIGFGAIAMFAYSIGLGLLFWVVGTFSVSLPKSGHWLEWVKSFFGTVLVVMALYYVRDLVPGLSPETQSMPLIVVTVTLFLLGMALGAIDLSFHGERREKLQKAAAVLFAVAGLFGQVQWAGALPAGAHIEWLDDYHTARERALAENKPLLVDFGASWCGACGELDRHTFTDPRVVAQARHFIPVRVDLSPDVDTPEKRAVLASYEQRGLPLVVLHDRAGGEVARLTRFAPPDEFLEILRRVD